MPRVLTSILTLTLIPLAGLPAGVQAAEDPADTASYVEIHTWVPATVALYPDGTEVHCPGYWQVTRRPLGSEAIPPNQPPGAIAVQAPTVEVAVVPTEPSVVADDCGPRPCARQGCEVVVPVAVAVPPPQCHGVWRAIFAPWHDPACFRGSLTPGAEEHHDHGGGGGGHGHWVVPFSPLAPLQLLGHLHFR